VAAPSRRSKAPFPLRKGWASTSSDHAATRHIESYRVVFPTLPPQHNCGLVVAYEDDQVDLTSMPRRVDKRSWNTSSAGKSGTPRPMA
jgi:hypothetical protein